jgi:hypothetical protein
MTPGHSASGYRYSVDSVLFKLSQPPRQDFKDDERNSGNLKPWFVIRDVSHRPIPESPVFTIQSKIEKSNKLINLNAVFRFRDAPLLTK